MRKFQLAFLFSLILSQLSFGQAQQISLEDICQKYKFYAASPEGFNFMNDGEHYSVVEDNGIQKYNVVSGKKTETLFTQTDFSFDSYEFSEDENKILFQTQVEPLYRHSSKASYLIYDRKTKKSLTLSEAGKQRLASFNSKADKVAFIRNNNFYYRDLITGKEVAVTKDGLENKIINGATDWVYEEEFSLDLAYYWSPDGSMIAFVRFDESEVKEFQMEYYKNELYPDPYTFKYPKAGETNSKVSVHLFELKTGKTRVLNTAHDADGYIPRIKWTPDNKLCVFTLNRHQNHLKIISFQADGSSQLILEEKNKYYIDIHDYMQFVDESQFIWVSEKDGYRHLYLHQINGKESKQLTKGNWDLTNFYGYSPEQGRLYYQAAKEKSYQRDVYMMELSSGKEIKISSSEGESEANFGKGFKYFVLNHSTKSTPPVYKLLDTKSFKEITVLEDNQPLNQYLGQLELGEMKYFTFRNEAGTPLNGWMMLPANFDMGKKYPVMMYVYGGPGNPTATDGWDNGNHGWFRMLSQKGYIVVTVDGRGTEQRGEEFRKCTYLQLGKFETEDQIATAAYLGNLPFVEKSRIGIFGWSFGGYLSSLCITKGADQFKLAIAVAPVTNWKWYDSIYTERYMRTPAENEKGYEENSPVNFADRLKGKYLLVHGMADDNVHFQHAAEMAKELIKFNKPFEQMFYPNKNHGIYGGLTRLHLYSKMTQFILDNL